MSNLKRPQPNADDPLSEPTPGRRLWAARIRAKYSRQSFAKAVGVAYTTADNWETDTSIPETATLTAACALVGFTTDEILTGRQSGTSTVVPSIARAPRPPATSSRTVSTEATFSEVEQTLKAEGATEPERTEVLAELREKAGLGGIDTSFVRGLLTGIRRLAAGKALKDASPRETDGRAKAGAELTDTARRSGAAKGHMQLVNPKAGKRAEPMSGKRQRTGK